MIETVQAIWSSNAVRLIVNLLTLCVVVDWIRLRRRS